MAQLFRWDRSVNRLALEVRLSQYLISSSYWYGHLISLTGWFETKTLNLHVNYSNRMRVLELDCRIRNRAYSKLASEWLDPVVTYWVKLRCRAPSTGVPLIRAINLLISFKVRGGCKRYEEVIERMDYWLRTLSSPAEVIQVWCEDRMGLSSHNIGAPSSLSCCFHTGRD